ncbi:hypothetical protein Syun_003464 [Stephania yunnanensis]|uniref:Uncharacterized protein n=1 Tax=Stephania yunnanensis TaxID=152371 RepID=A0AAP0PZV4_9MAGN
MATTSCSTYSSSIDSSSSSSRRDRRLRLKNRDSIKIRKKRESRSKRRRRHRNGGHTSSSSSSDYRFFSSTDSSSSSSRPPSSPKEQGLDQDPQEEGVAIEAQKKASQRRPRLFFLFVRLQEKTPKTDETERTTKDASVDTKQQSFESPKNWPLEFRKQQKDIIALAPKTLISQGSICGGKSGDLILTVFQHEGTSSRKGNVGSTNAEDVSREGDISTISQIGVKVS